MCFNPGDGQGVLEAYIMEELANSLNKRFVATGLDRVVPSAVNTVRARRLTRCGVPGECCLESLEGQFRAW